MLAAESLRDSQIKKKRIHVTSACLPCKLAHTSCNNVRPCLRCSEKGKECVESQPKKRGRKKHLKNIIQSLSNSPFSPTFPANDRPTYDILKMFEQSSLESVEKALMFSSLQQMEHIEVDPNGPTLIPNDTLAFMSGYILARLPELKPAAEFSLHVREKMLRNTITEDMAQKIRQDFLNSLQIFSSAFDQLDIPVIIWERCSSIRYINQAYKDLTGFNLKLPTPIRDLSFMEQLSTEGLNAYINGIFQIHHKVETEPQKNNVQIYTGIRTSQGKFIYGTLWITVKMDYLGAPLMMIGLFLPEKSLASQSLTKFN